MLTICDFNSFWAFLGHPVEEKNRIKVKFKKIFEGILDNSI